MNKPTKAEKIEMLDIILELVITGMKPRHIVQYLAEKKNIVMNPRTLSNYIAEVTDIIRKESNTDREKEVGLAKRRYDNLYFKCISIQDYKTALAIQKERAILLGINQPIKTDITTAGEKITLEVIYKTNAKV